MADSSATFIPANIATASDAASDALSKIAAVSDAASDASSDAASKVAVVSDAASKAMSQANSVASVASDAKSAASDALSKIAVVSDVASDAISKIAVISDVASDALSKANAVASVASDALSAASDASSKAGVALAAAADGSNALSKITAKSATWEASSDAASKAGVALSSASDALSATTAYLDQSVKTTASPTFDNLYVENTTSSVHGIISNDRKVLVHDFQHPTGGGGVPEGYNVFVGGAGNFTMGSTATNSAESSKNIGIGVDSLLNCTKGSELTAVGWRGLYNATTAAQCFALGSAALYNMLSGNSCIAIGPSALYTGTTFYQNIAIGYQALYDLTGVAMIAIGFRAGHGATSSNAPVTDSEGILIGNDANRSVASGTQLSNYIGIGQGVLIDKSNQVKIGNSSITENVFYGNILTSGNADIEGVYKVDGTQVVGNRVIDARCDDVCNSGDATTDGVIDALRDAMITHGLIAAA